MNESQTIILELGDIIARDGERQVVVAVSATCARILQANGATTIIPNPIPETYDRVGKTRLPKGREEGMKEMNLLLDIHGGKRAELTKPITPEEIESMSTPAKKSEAYKTKPRGGLAAQKKETEGSAKPAKAAKASKSPKEPKAPKTPKEKKETRASYTRGLALDKSKTVEEIHKLAKAKYASSDMSTTKRLVEEARKA